MPSSPLPSAVAAALLALALPAKGDALTMVDLAAMVVLRTVPVPGTPDGVAVLGARR